MKRIAFFLSLTLILVSCGTDGHHFKLDGRLLHLNQGEFYVYSPDGAMQGIDTIKVQAGRFTYETPCDNPMTLMIVFPNFTEQPVFAQPGKSVDIKGDASHLKEMTVKGTKDNELMNTFREQASSASPAEVRKYAVQFVKDHPESRVGAYLVRKYFIQTPTPDYAQARTLLTAMLAAQPDNGTLRLMQRQIAGLGTLSEGSTVPGFSATDVHGKAVSSAMLTSAQKAIVCVWASWSYESISQLRMLCQQQASQGFTLLSICLDASPDECRRTLERNSFSCTTLCDGNMLDGRVYRLLGFFNVPDNMVLRSGRVVRRGLDFGQLQSEALSK